MTDSVLLKLFDKGIEDAIPKIPQRMSGALISNIYKQYTIHDPRGPDKYNYTMI